MIGSLSSLVVAIAPLFALGLSMYLSLRNAKFADFTVDGSFAMGLALTFYVVELAALPTWIALLASSVGGALCGVLTAFLYSTVLKDSPIFKLLAGLLVTFSAYSVTFRLVGTESRGMPTRNFFDAVTDLESGGPLSPVQLLTGLTATACVLLPAVALVAWLSSGQGIVARAAGCRPLLFRTMGGRESRYLVLWLLVANGFAALGGSLDALLNHSGRYREPGVIVEALAVFLLGEAIFKRRALRTPLWAVTSCLAGALLYAVVREIAALVLLKADGSALAPQDYKLVTAAVILITVGIRKLVSRADSAGLSSEGGLI